jgi:hypothetical protein
MFSNTVLPFPGLNISLDGISLADIFLIQALETFCWARRAEGRNRGLETVGSELLFLLFGLHVGRLAYDHMLVESRYLPQL